MPLYGKRSVLTVETVVGKTTNPQRKFPRENVNLRESLNHKHIVIDLIYVGVLIQANIASNAMQNF